MTEENQIVPNDTQNNNLKSFIFNNKKSVISFFIIIFLSLFSYFFYSDYKKNIKSQISEKYNLAINNYDKSNPQSSIEKMNNIINKKDSTYSPLALYFLLDNNLLTDKNKINKYFDILIYEVDLDDEIKNLIIYKKGFGLIFLRTINLCSKLLLNKRFGPFV